MAHNAYSQPDGARNKNKPDKQNASNQASPSNVAGQGSPERGPDSGRKGGVNNTPGTQRKGKGGDSHQNKFITSQKGAAMLASPKNNSKGMKSANTTGTKMKQKEEKKEIFYSLRNKVTEQDTFCEFGLETKTEASQKIHLKRLYRQRCNSKKLKHRRINEQRESIERNKQDARKGKPKQVSLQISTKGQQAALARNMSVTNRDKKQVKLPNQQPLAPSGSKGKGQLAVKRHDSVPPKNVDKRRSALDDHERTSTMSPVVSNKNRDGFPSPNRKFQQKKSKFRNDPSLSRISRDYSIDSINSYDESVHGSDNRAPMESKSSIMLAATNTNQDSRSVIKGDRDGMGASPGFNRKTYKRQLTNVNNEEHTMLLNVGFENKVKLSSSRGRKPTTRANSRGDNHEQSPGKKHAVNEVKKQDSLSNGPSDFNKKLKILTSRNRGSTDLHSISIMSKKEMVKLQREQRIYDLYMKAPYKLIDKKQQDRQQRKLDIDDLMIAPEGSKTGSSYFQNKRATMGSYMSTDNKNGESSLKKQTNDREAQKRGATSNNLQYLQHVFEKRHNESYDQQPQTTRNNHTKPLKTKSPTARTGNVNHIPKSTFSAQSKIIELQDHEGPDNTSQLRCVEEQEKEDATPRNDDASLYAAQRLRLPVDKRKAERKNTWGSQREHTNTNQKHYSHRAGAGSITKHQHGTKYGLNQTQLSAVKSGGDNTEFTDSFSGQALDVTNNLQKKGYSRRMPAFQQHKTAVKDRDQLSPLEETYASGDENRKNMDVNFHITQVYGRGANNSLVDTSKWENEKRQRKHRMDPSKYINSRLYDQGTRNEGQTQTTNQPTGEMPPIFDTQKMRPKFLGGQFTSKINDKSESKVKNYLIGQCSTREGNDIVEQYFKQKMNLRTELENIYKTKTGSPARGGRKQGDDKTLLLPEIENSSEQNKAASKGFDTSPNKHDRGTVTVKRSLQDNSGVAAQ